MGRDDDGDRGCGRVGVEGETARGATLAVCVVLVKLRSAAVRAELEVGEWVWVLHIYIRCGMPLPAVPCRAVLPAAAGPFSATKLAL